MYKNGVQSYRRTNVNTADPKRLVLMCYEGAIDQLKIGKQKIIEKDYEAKSNALIKTQDIISELLCSLDFEKGGIIAQNLDSLYNYMLRRIMHASLENDLEAVDEIIGILSELESAWREIFYKKPEEIQPEAVGFGEEQSAQASGYINA